MKGVAHREGGSGVGAGAAASSGSFEDEPPLLRWGAGRWVGSLSDLVGEPSCVLMVSLIGNGWEL